MPLNAVAWHLQVAKIHIMLDLKKYTAWLVVGSQHLYGAEALQQVAQHAAQMAAGFNTDPEIPVTVELKPVAATPDTIRNICRAANSDTSCIGIITWMHTFSPAKMWIAGLRELQKPLLQLHTQFNRDIPWDSIDMDFMNLNQSAHGDREFGHITARLRLRRKVIAGYWKDLQIREEIGQWTRAATASVVGQSLKVARFGDNMRDVAVTEGDKVEAQARFGWSVNGYGVGDLVECINGFSDAEIDAQLRVYEELYDFAPNLRSAGPLRDRVREQAKIELGLRAFLSSGGFDAFTTTFEDLHGLAQLPGLAVQRLMADGYGFAGEGDWKTAALVRTMKIMGAGLAGGTSFMEDYTYHLEPGHELVLGAHMLEICPSIAAGRPKLEVHPLSIGSKADPARLVFDGAAGPSVVASVIDLGNRFRLIINCVESVKPSHAMPKLPVARVLWKPQPSLRIAAESWILAGGAHHSGFSLAVNADHMIDWAEIVGIEWLLIDSNTSSRGFSKELRWSEACRQ